MVGSKKGACSSHTQAAKANCLAHNRREGNVPSYVNTHLSDTNRTIYEDAAIRTRKSIVPLVKAAERDYTQKTGQKCQKSFAPFRESCLVVKAGVTDKQLLDFKDKAEKLTGWKCLGIWLHQDEGHAHSKYIEGNENYAINYHAHVLWDCVNHDSGKAIRCDRTKLSRMQDVLADAVGMERGNPASLTGRRGRDAQAQRKRAEEQRIAALRSKIAEKDAMIAERDARIANGLDRLKDSALSFFGSSPKDEKIKKLTAEVGELRKALAQASEDERQHITSAVRKAVDEQRKADGVLLKKAASERDRLAGDRVRLAGEIDILQKQVSALRVLLGGFMPKIKAAVIEISRKSSSPTSRTLRPEQRTVIDDALGSDESIPVRKSRAVALMELARLGIGMDGHVPAAWIESTSDEVMAIAERKEDDTSEKRTQRIRK